MNHRKSIRNIFTFLLILLYLGCKRIPVLPDIDLGKLTKNQEQTLSSLQQLNDYPFFSMRYYGDYDERLLKIIKEELGIQINACSTFTAANVESEKILARNHDWPENPVLILLSYPENKLASISMVDLFLLGYTKDSSFSTLNEKSKLLYSIFIPMDGMNERGIAIGAMGCMGLDSKNEKIPVYSNEIIRIVLDTAETMNDVIEIFENYSIYNPVIPLHYIVSDSIGNSAIIEYIDGKVQVQELDQNSKVLTNFRYYGNIEKIKEKSNEYLSTGKINKDVFGNSYLRYIKIKQKLMTSNGILSESESMNLLKEVSMEMKSFYGDFYTVWSVVYNLSNKKIDVAIGRNYNDIYSFELEQ